MKKDASPKQEKQPVKQPVKQTFSAPKGMHDVLPGEWRFWERVFAATEKFAGFYDFGRISTPVLERAELFERGIGIETDAVQKELYILKTKGGDALALRPELTSAVVRAYLEHRMGRTGQVQKLWYFEPMFRHDRPQAGRYRQFTQIGFEILGGTSEPFYDAEIVLLSLRTLEELKLRGLVLRVNSIGCRVCRPVYIKQLQNYYRNRVKNLCENCEQRFKTNPLRLLDCKGEACVAARAHAPNILDKLCNACSTHLSTTLEYLDELKVSYSIDQHLVRGLDYYSRTVFEISVEGPGAEVGSLFGGGRYDYLFESLGARQNPAVGSAGGVERIVEVMKAQEIVYPERKLKRVFLVHVGEMAKKKLLSIAEILRVAGIPIAESVGKDSLKAQLKHADKGGARLALILGQKELFEESIILRDLRGSSQETIRREKMVDEIKKRLK